jgi:hypothetical protein
MKRKIKLPPIPKSGRKSERFRHWRIKADKQGMPKLPYNTLTNPTISFEENHVVAKDQNRIYHIIPISEKGLFHDIKSKRSKLYKYLKSGIPTNANIGLVFGLRTPSREVPSINYLRQTGSGVAGSYRYGISRSLKNKHLEIVDEYVTHIQIIWIGKKQARRYKFSEKKASEFLSAINGNT